MDKKTQKAMAASFRAMHRGGRILVLPNAWDAASARVFEEAGFGAIATTSAGIAFTLGYPDGQRISREEMLGVVRRIAAAVKVPVTADVEAGYGERPEDAARTARDVGEAGAVGMNMEDATGDPQRPLLDLALQVERVTAVREAMRGDLVLNARTDVYLLELEAPDKRYDAALRRLAAYRDAGADCVFVPGLADAGIIGRLVKDLGCPINILVGPGSPSIPELEKLGVARVSVGSGAMRAAMGLTRRIAKELRESGSYQSLEGAIPYAELNRMMG
jgi:2-methylisocitrate lyase-like PEP mutase family enzyme